MRLLGGRWGNLEKPAPDDRVRCFLDRKAQSWCSTRSVDWYYSTRKCIAVYGQRQSRGMFDTLVICLFFFFARPHLPSDARIMQQQWSKLESQHLFLGVCL